MKINFGQNTTLVIDGGIETKAGSSLITKNRTFVLRAGARTAANTYIFKSASSAQFDLATSPTTGLRGFKCPIPFTVTGQTGSITTYVSIGGGAGNQGTLDSFYNVNTVTANYGYIPWSGSILGFGLRSRNPRTAGSATFVVMNGNTVLTSLTLNSTNTKRINGALITPGAQPFTANNLRIKIKTSAAWQPGWANPISGIVWVEV